MGFLDEKDLSTLWGKIKDLMKSNGALAAYPVGSIFMSTSSTNPSTTLGGGTWERWGEGRVPVGVDTSQTEFNSVQKTGGEKTVRLSESNMPSHTHSVPSHSHSVGSGGSHNHRMVRLNSSAANGSGKPTGPFAMSNQGSSGYTTIQTSSDGSHSHSISGGSCTTGSRGSGTAHNNLQPYITCYMWRRIA